MMPPKIELFVPSVEDTDVDRPLSKDHYDLIIDNPRARDRSNYYSAPDPLNIVSPFREDVRNPYLHGCCQDLALVDPYPLVDYHDSENYAKETI